MAELLLVGVNYKKAALHIRERLVIRTDCVEQGLSALSTQTGSTELVLLSTCNRTEVYAYTGQVAETERAIRSFFTLRAGLATGEMDDILYVLTGQVAARHLLRVACGLDSMVTGENEIQGQVRDAFCLAQAAGQTGPVLSALFRAATTTGKRVRSGTEIGRTGLSIASVVVQLAEEKIGPLHDKTALLIGAGKISTATARALKVAGLRWILLANRTFDRAQKLARTLQGQAVHFDMLDEHLEKADIVICSTGAPHFVLHPEAVERALLNRQDHQLLVIDLAVPRDVDPAISCMPGVHLVDMDGLQGLAYTYQPLTLLSLQTAEKIIVEELIHFEEWLSARRQAPVIQALCAKADKIVDRQVDLTLHKLGALTPQQRQCIQSMAHAIVKQLLHDPIEQLKTPPEEIELGEYVQLVEGLFGLK